MAGAGSLSHSGLIVVYFSQNCLKIEQVDKEHVCTLQSFLGKSGSGNTIFLSLFFFHKNVP